MIGQEGSEHKKAGGVTPQAAPHLEGVRGQGSEVSGEKIPSPESPRAARAWRFENHTLTVVAIGDGYYGCTKIVWGKTGLKRVHFNPSGQLPLRKTRQRAEADLVRFAENYGLQEV